MAKAFDPVALVVNFPIQNMDDEPPTETKRNVLTFDLDSTGV